MANTHNPTTLAQAAFAAVRCSPDLATTPASQRPAPIARLRALDFATTAVMEDLSDGGADDLALCLASFGVILNGGLA